MKRKYEELAKEILKIKTREEAMHFFDGKDKLFNDFVEEEGELINEALTHLCILVTPEDYDDDICD